MNNLGLSYARPTSTYAGLPTGTLKEVLQQKQQDFFAARDTADKLETALANIEVDPQNQYIKDAAVQRMQDTYKQVKEVGDWENAGLIVRDAAKAFATDQALNAAVSDRQKRTQAITDLKAQVAAGTITQSDADFVLSEANKNYTGVKHDESTGWKGTFTYSTPPQYINIGEYTDKFLNDFKPDQFLGQYVKKEDGWYKVNGTKVTDGGYEYMVKSERASYEEVYQAARQYVLQDSKVTDRVAFEALKDKRTFDDIAAGEPDKARSSLIDDLIDFAGFDAAKLKTLSNDELMLLYKKESVVHNSIAGPVSKHAYTKETIDTFGMTWQAKEKLETSKRKAESTAGEVTVGDLRTILQNNFVSIQNPFQHPTTLEEHNTAINEKTKAISALDKDISNIAKNIEATKQKLSSQGITNVTSHPEVQNMQREYDDLVFEKQTLEFEIENAEERYNTAKNKLIASGEINEDKLKRVETLQRNQSADVLALSKYMIDNAIKNKRGDVGRELTEEEITNIKKQWGVDALMRPTIDKGNPFRAEGSGYDIAHSVELKKVIDVNSNMWKNYVKNYVEPYSKIGAEDISHKIQTEMKKAADEIFVQTAYFNIGLGNGDKRSEWGNKSKFATQVEYDFLNNKNGWIIIDSKGKRLYDDKPRDRRNMDVEEINVLGLTTESVGNYGYLVAANIKRRHPDRDKGNKGAKQEETVYLVPGSGINQSGILELAKLELLDGNAQLIGDSGSATASTAVDLARKLDRNVIDKQMAQFNDHRIEPNQNITKKIAIGIDGKYAEVSRITGNNTGVLEYRTVIKNSNGTIDMAGMGGASFLTHKDQFALEGDLEHFTSYMFDAKYAGTRAVRHNNPGAFTVDIAKQAGLKEGVDYTIGDSFKGSNGETLYTAKLLGDSMKTTIQVIDKIGLVNSSGKPRWSYVSAKDQEAWNKMTYSEKEAFVKKMQQIEIGLND